MSGRRMKVPMEWLQEYCDPQLDTPELAQRLTMTGTKVEGIERHGVGELEKFVVGRVLEAGKHPDADRLSVCLVDIGGAEPPAQIVCGAPNVAAGQTVAVAKPGAVMPDGTKLGRAKLRGVESGGMILAEDELGDRRRPRRDHGTRGRRSAARDAARPRCSRSPPTWSSSRSPRTARIAWRCTGSRASCTRRPARP